MLLLFYIFLLLLSECMVDCVEEDWVFWFIFLFFIEVLIVYIWIMEIWWNFVCRVMLDFKIYLGGGWIGWYEVVWMCFCLKYNVWGGYSMVLVWEWGWIVVSYVMEFNGKGDFIYWCGWLSVRFCCFVIIFWNFVLEFFRCLC